MLVLVRLCITHFALHEACSLHESHSYQDADLISVSSHSCESYCLLQLRLILGLDEAPYEADLSSVT